MKKYKILFFMIILNVFTLNIGYSQKELRLEVNAGKYRRDKTPVILKLPDSLQKNDKFTLSRTDTGKVVDVQLLPGKYPAIVWLIQEPLKPGEKREYLLKTFSDSRAEKTFVTCNKNDKNLQVKVGARTVLQYNHKMIPSPFPEEPFWKHNGHIHPVYNPAGQVLTDDFPPDHRHQRGIFFPWVNTTYKGKSLDFWNLKKQTGTVEHKEFAGIISGRVFAQFKVILHHVDISTKGKSVPVLKETWTVRVYNISDYFLFDIESRQNCSSDEPLKINEYHYGGMAIRGVREWLDKSKGNFLTSEGKTRKDGNHSRPRWVDIHGFIEGKETGITVMCHPGNFRFPQPVRLHPKKPYFCFAPMVLGDFSIEPGKEYVSRYRYYCHNGKPDPEETERLWQDFSQPPEVNIVK